MKLVFVVVFACAVGCAHEPGSRRVPAGVVQTTSAVVPAAHDVASDVRVSNEIARRCAVHFGAGERAPEFAYDDAGLDRQDRDLLAQLAKCLVGGALDGRRVLFVGHTDAYGEPEYNMTLGARRADSAARYLVQLGVTPARIHETSRGELDASGDDRAGRQRDRRVDVVLEPAAR